MTVTATGRTTKKYGRLYGGNSAFGYAFSADASNIGTAGHEWETEHIAALEEAVKGTYLGQAKHSLGPINTIMKTTATATGLHDYLVANASPTLYMAAAIGIQAAPLTAAPCFVAPFKMTKYQADFSKITIAANIELEPLVNGLNYEWAWGNVLHPYGAETGANTGTTNVIDAGAATTKGGYFYYCLTSVNAGTVTLSVDDSADNSTYGALSGATSGALAAGNAGIVQLATSATVKRYIRWQLAFAGGANTATFFAAFVRGR